MTHGPQTAVEWWFDGIPQDRDEWHARRAEMLERVRIRSRMNPVFDNAIFREKMRRHCGFDLIGWLQER